MVKVGEGQVKDFGSAGGRVLNRNGGWEGEGGCRSLLFKEKIADIKYFNIISKVFFFISN